MLHFYVGFYLRLCSNPSPFSFLTSSNEFNEVEAARRQKHRSKKNLMPARIISKIYFRSLKPITLLPMSKKFCYCAVYYCRSKQANKKLFRNASTLWHLSQTVNL